MQSRATVQSLGEVQTSQFDYSILDAKLQNDLREFPENRIDDDLYQSYKYEHGKIDAQCMFMQKLKHYTHDDV